MRKKPTNSKELLGFEADVMTLVRYIERTWDGPRDIKPKGYNDLMNNYNDWDGMDDFDEKAACNHFDGYDDVDGTYFPFPVRTSLPHVAYEVCNQVDSPLFILLAACVTYGCMRGQIYGREKERHDIWLENLEADNE